MIPDDAMRHSRRQIVEAQLLLVQRAPEVAEALRACETPSDAERAVGQLLQLHEPGQIEAVLAMQFMRLTKFFEQRLKEELEDLDQSGSEG